ncbi:hypothetical protein [Rarobacter faecitabidus]|uniref:Uncharacterized protein n=1 Tax=Rarobacter faecitabidus TaxID=13243 RepID=A0A542ZE36_RARFA|nr:hypothetical protein [Rarobacter faecitabidus]TQL58549.1 hypothetical protein FB461_1964 [Rarobacter faecitabidus]
MTSLLAALLTVLYLVALIGSSVWALERESWARTTVPLGLRVLGLAFLFHEFAAEEAKGPSLWKETSVVYNAATKTTMPCTVCVERGTLVNK